jgi:cytochrome c-type biogenesis protein CcmH/NrfG
VDATERLARLQAALTRLENDQSRQAERICRQLLDRDGADIEALLLLGLAVGARGNTDMATAILNRVARARGSNAHPCSDLARMLIAQGKASLV